jgi:glutamate racemase
MSAPTILVFDSGFGGLTVFREVAKARPDADYVYVADDAAFPYGRLGERELVDRVVAVFDAMVAEFRPALVVVACNTASTLVLPALRARFDIPFVGTVPAIKPAAEASRTRRVAVLATPGTVARDYTRELVARFAGDCSVDLVGAPGLAGLAEAKLRGEPVPDAAVAAEIAPCFVDRDGRATDHVVLACTHYPLLAAEIARLAPWPVTLVDPAPAIARRVTTLLGPADGARPPGRNGGAVFTGRVPESMAERAALAGYGVGSFLAMPMPLAR